MTETQMTRMVPESPAPTRRRTPAEYRKAQQILWGDPGAWAADTFAELNAEYFAGEVPSRGIVWGLTHYGDSLGHTYSDGRITLHPSLLDPHFNNKRQSEGRQSEGPWKKGEYLGEGYARDVLLHEMIHALLFSRGRRADHNDQPWCNQVERLAPLLDLGRVQAAPVHPRRVNGKVVRLALPGYLDRDTISRFPHPLRPDAWYLANRSRIRVWI